MKLRIALALFVGSSAAIGCFQTIDNGIVGGPTDPNSTATSSGGAVAIGTLVDAGLPDAFAGVSLQQQCEAGSALCYQLCDSPECATDDGGMGVVLPPVLLTPSYVLPDGGQSTSPCDQLEAASLKIRQDSCSQCHSENGAKLTYTWILDDQALVSQAPPGLPAPLVIPGNPYGSALLQKMVLGFGGGQLGMPPPPSLASQLTSSDAAATIVYPTSEDVSVMYAWVLLCAPGADAGGFQGAFGGGNPDGGSYAPPLVVGDGGH